MRVARRWRTRCVCLWGLGQYVKLYISESGHAVVFEVHGGRKSPVIADTKEFDHGAATAATTADLPNTATHNDTTIQDKNKLTIETPLVRDIIHEQYTHRASIICRRDRPESFLSSRVPYLQFHALAIEFYRADLEVYANRRDE
jgi:hypothetical protein